MKIRNTHSPIPIDSARRAKGARPSASSPARAEKVQVSDEARSLREAKAPEVPDQARIDALKDAIREGRFEIDAGKIADVMMREEL